MTFELFAHQMGRLGGLKYKPADLQTHWEALGNLEPSVLEAAVSHAQRACVDFPTPAELLAFAEAYRMRRPVPPAVDRSTPLEGDPLVIRAPEHLGGAVVVTADRVWTPVCETCGDTGIVSYWCGEAPSARWPDLPRRRCGRVVHLYDHAWVEPCACAGRNPDVQRRRAVHGQVPNGRGKA